MADVRPPASVDSLSITSISRSIDEFEVEMETIMKSFTDALKGLPEPMTSRYRFKGLLGYGGNGFVADGVDAETGMELAIKFIPKSRISKESLVYSSNLDCLIPLEAHVLQSLQHPNIVTFIFFLQCDKYVYIGMEKAKKLTWRLGDDQPGIVTVDSATGNLIEETDVDFALPQPAEAVMVAPSTSIPRSFMEGGHKRAQSLGGVSVLGGVTTSSASSIVRNGSIRSQQRSSQTHIGSLHRHVLTAVSPSTPLPDSSVIPWQTSISRRRQRSSIAQFGPSSLGSPGVVEAPSPFSLISSEGLTTVTSHADPSAFHVASISTLSKGEEPVAYRITASPGHVNAISPDYVEPIASNGKLVGPEESHHPSSYLSPIRTDNLGSTVSFPHPLDENVSEGIVQSMVSSQDYSGTTPRASLSATEVAKRNSSSFVLTRPRHSHPGDLYDFVTMYGVTPPAVQRHIFRQLVSAYAAIRAQGFVYLDFRGENVLIDDDLAVKLVDFGMAQREIVPPSDELFLQYGTREASAPEVLRGEGYLGPEADIWALGLILFMIATGGDDAFKSESEALRGDIPFPSDLEEDCRNLISKMLTSDRRQRASLADIQNHAFVMPPSEISDSGVITSTIP
ncbi:Protein kinase [Dinochytrium kinnereticum]|nr:Protein kinase [Dinochytrium kinnereticum]